MTESGKRFQKRQRDLLSDEGSGGGRMNTAQVLLTLRVDGEEVTYGLEIDTLPLLDDALEMMVRGPLVRKWLTLIREHPKVSVA